MIVLSFSNYIKNANYLKTIDYIKLPFGFGIKIQMWYSFKTITNGCAYVCVLHVVQIKMNSLLDYCLSK